MQISQKLLNVVELILLQVSLRRTNLVFAFARGQTELCAQVMRGGSGCELSMARSSSRGRRAHFYNNCLTINRFAI